MKRQGNLFQRIINFENFEIAAKKAYRGKKSKVGVSSFYFNLENEIIELQMELQGGHYLPLPYRQFEVREPKIRKICSAEFRDRVVHHAICNVLDPIFDRAAICDSYACRVGKGTHSALRRCQEFTRKNSYFLKCDIKKYFESIDHEILKLLLRRIIKDREVLELLDLIIDHPVPGNEKGKGLPIGNLMSQYFANLYLGILDHLIKDKWGIQSYLRYMDDFIVFIDSKECLQENRIRLEPRDPGL